ncbi:MAG: hypothetical protein K9L31_00935 [Candidatus Pacebacteria bacterium]|nr:hypothetical protein [Candidatus Paceibacterota bacterium]
MEKIFAFFGKSLVAIILLTMLTIVTNATMVPAVIEIANQLNYVNWQSYHQLFHIVMKYTIWGIFCLYAVALVFKTPKSKQVSVEEESTG